MNTKFLIAVIIKLFKYKQNELIEIINAFEEIVQQSCFTPLKKIQLFIVIT